MNKIAKSRQTISKAFKKDPSFRYTYIANISCLLMDKLPGLKRDKEKRDSISDSIITLVFDS